MKKLGKFLHIMNLVLLFLMTFHLLGCLALSWLFEELFFDSVWYVLLLCFTLGLERWVQVFTEDTARGRIMTTVSALLLTAAAVHMLLAGISQPDPIHDEALICTFCIRETLESYYILPLLVWAVIRLAVLLDTAPQGQRLTPLIDLLVMAIWIGYVLSNGTLAGYQAGAGFIPALMAANTVMFLVRNIRETVQLAGDYTQR